MLGELDGLVTCDRGSCNLVAHTAELIRQVRRYDLFVFDDENTYAHKASILPS